MSELNERCSVPGLNDAVFNSGRYRVVSQGLNSFALDRTVQLFKKSSVYRED